MRGEVLTGACRAEMPQHLACWHHEGGNQDTHPMADVLLLAFLWLTRLGQLRGMFALENLHPRLFVDTDDQASLLVETQGVDIEVAEVPGLSLERGVMTIEPVHAPMWFEVGGIERPPDG